MPLDVLKNKNKLNSVVDFCEKLTTFRNFISVFAVPEGKSKKDAISYRIVGSYSFLK